MFFSSQGHMHRNRYSGGERKEGYLSYMKEVSTLIEDGSWIKKKMWTCWGIKITGLRNQGAGGNNNISKTIEAEKSTEKVKYRAKSS